MAMPHRIGLISDTHGLLRPEAKSFLEGCDHIVHAGDIGDAEVLEQLAVIAPLTAVRGNNDTADWARALAETARLRIGNVFIYVIHDIARIAVDPPGPGMRVVVSGHSHRPGIHDRDGVLYVNPGSAGRRRFTLPISIGELLIGDDSIAPRLVVLEPRSG